MSGNQNNNPIPYFNPNVPPPSIPPRFYFHRFVPPPPPAVVTPVPATVVSSAPTTTRKRPSRFSDAVPKPVISVPPPPVRFDELKKIDRRKRSENETEREKILRKWRSNYCETSEQMSKKLAELADSEEKQYWIRSSPSDIYYKRTVQQNGIEVEATPRLEALCELFERELIIRAENAREAMPKYTPPPRKEKRRLCRHKSEVCSSSDDSSDEEFHPEQDCSMEELSMKTQHPHRLHADLWHNEPGEMNDGPLCR